MRYLLDSRYTLSHSSMGENPAIIVSLIEPVIGIVAHGRAAEKTHGDCMHLIATVFVF